jgi:hypothetical protein
MLDMHKPLSAVTHANGSPHLHTATKHTAALVLHMLQLLMKMAYWSMRNVGLIVDKAEPGFSHQHAARLPQVCPWGVRWATRASASALEHACEVPSSTSVTPKGEIPMTFQFKGVY